MIKKALLSVSVTSALLSASVFAVAPPGYEESASVNFKASVPKVCGIKLASTTANFTASGGSGSDYVVDSSIADGNINSEFAVKFNSDANDTVTPIGFTLFSNTAEDVTITQTALTPSTDNQYIATGSNTPVPIPADKLAVKYSETNQTDATHLDYGEASTVQYNKAGSNDLYMFLDVDANAHQILNGVRSIATVEIEVNC